MYHLVVGHSAFEKDGFRRRDHIFSGDKHLG